MDELAERRLEVVRRRRVRMVAFFEFAHRDGPDPHGIVCERVCYDLHTMLTQLGLA